MNYYEVLGVDSTANSAEIKSAYRQKVKKYHPDINPDVPNKDEIIRIYEAYEILSDPTTRGLFDLYLQGTAVKSELEEFDEEERKKSEFIQHKIRQQRQSMADQILYRQKFYRYLRWVCFAGFFVSFVLSYDYYSSDAVDQFVPDKVIAGRNATLILFGNDRISTSGDFYPSYVQSNDKKVTVYFSSLLDIPKTVKMTKGEKEFSVRDTIYVFKNAFSFILFLSSIAVVGNKRYTDFRLTCGLISAMTLLWTLLMIFPYF